MLMHDLRHFGHGFSRWEMTRVQEVMASNPYTVYWMDMTFIHIDLLLKL